MFKRILTERDIVKMFAFIKRRQELPSSQPDALRADPTIGSMYAGYVTYGSTVSTWLTYAAADARRVSVEEQTTWI